MADEGLTLKQSGLSISRLSVFTMLIRHQASTKNYNSLCLKCLKLHSVNR